MAHSPVVERITIWGTYCAKPIGMSCIEGFNQRPGGADSGALRRRLHGLGESLDAAKREFANKAINQRVACRDVKSWALDRVGDDPVHTKPEFANVVSHRVTAVLLDVRRAHDRQHSLGQD